MTSMLCVQEPGGFIEHNSRDLAEKLLRDSANHAIYTQYFPGNTVKPNLYARRPFSTPNPHIKTDTLDRQGLMGHSMKLQNWLSRKAVHLVQEKSDLEAKPVKDMYGAVLNTEETFVKDIKDQIDHHDFLGLRKKEVMHKNWTEKVYEPLRRVIIKEMDSEAYDNFKRRRDELYREYIEHRNKKGHVFCDDFDPEEYYPLGLHASRPVVVAPDIAHHNSRLRESRKILFEPLKVTGLQATTSKPLQDPTLLQSRNRYREDQTVLRCTSGAVYSDRSVDKVRLPTLPLAPQGRHDTENATWTAMPLTDIESPQRQASRCLSLRKTSQYLKPLKPKLLTTRRLSALPSIEHRSVMRRMQGINLKGEINFGQWSIQKYGQDTVDTEMGIQKRKHCRQPPFNSPRKVIYRKPLPAAQKSQISRTLPLPRPEQNEDTAMDLAATNGDQASDVLKAPLESINNTHADASSEINPQTLQQTNSITTRNQTLPANFELPATVF